MNSNSNPLDVQIGGKHYKELAIQPVEYIHANQLGFCEGNVVKYVSRWRAKNGIDDLRKARHYIELLIELEMKRAKPEEALTIKGSIIGNADFRFNDAVSGY